MSMGSSLTVLAFIPNIGPMTAAFVVGSLCGWFFAKFFLAYMWAKKRESLIR